MWSRTAWALATGCALAAAACSVDPEDLFSTPGAQQASSLDPEPGAGGSQGEGGAGGEDNAPDAGGPTAGSGSEEIDPDLPLGPMPNPDGDVDAEPVDAGTDAASDAAPVPPIVLTPPVVVSTSPGALEQGVRADAVVVVTFSLPMDRPSTEAAYGSELLPASGVAFSWNDDSTVLTVTPAAPLTLATGNNPDDVEPTRYELSIAETAESAEGAPLAEEHPWSFTTLRRITASLQSVRNRNLTGNFRSNNSQGVGVCTGNGSTNVCVGDSVLNNARYRGFLTFELGAIPVPVTELEAATLSLGVSNLLGDPFDDLGSLELARVAFAAINQAAFQTNVLTDLGVLANNANQGATIRRDVRDAIELDLASRTRAQFRLQFDDASDQDRANDVLVSSWTTHVLAITYLVP